MEELQADEGREGLPALAARRSAGELGAWANGTSGGGSVADAVGAERDAVLGYLRSRFRRSLNEADLEDLAQGACETVLRKVAHGEHVRDLAGFMKTIAWRDARDLIRDRREALADPRDDLFVAVEDRAGSPERRLGDRAQLARAIEAVEQLAPEQQAAYRARFVDELTTGEACDQLKLAKSTYHHRLRRAVDAVQATLDPGGFAQSQLRLLGAYVAGVASRSERRRAERLIRSDPQSAAVLRELRGAHESTAAALGPVVLQTDAPVHLLERLAALPGRLRDLAGGGLGRTREAAEATLPTAGASGGSRGAGAAATGALAQLAGLGGAAKVVVACVGAGAAAGACVATGIVPGLGGPDGDSPARERERPARVVPAATTPSMPATPIEQSPPLSKPEPKVVQEVEKKEQESVDAESQEVTQLAPSAPPVQQEFGLPAAAEPVSGGSSSPAPDGGSAVSREFGP